MDECGINRPTKAAKQFCVPLPCISLCFCGVWGLFQSDSSDFKFMHYIHFNKERKARNLKLVSVTLNGSQTPLVREESQQALAFTMISNMAFICCYHFSYKLSGTVCKICMDTKESSSHNLWISALHQVQPSQINSGMIALNPAE